jgi:hypothetical protein
MSDYYTNLKGGNVMKKLTRKSIMLLVGTMALAAVAGVARAETRFAVQDATGITDKFSVADDGKVGIGTTPTLYSAALDIKGTVYPYASIMTRFEGTTPGGGGGFLAYHNNAGGTLPVANDRLGYFLFGSMNGSIGMHAAGVLALAEGNWTTASTPSAFAFTTTPVGGISRIERLRITNTGYVGIGTALPTQKLEINGGVRLNTATAKPACNSGNRGTFWVTKAGVGVKDQVEVCIKDEVETYIWQAL